MSGTSDRHDNRLDLETTGYIQSLEHQISQLWHPDTTGDRPIASLATRANVLNLIAYTPDDDVARRTSVTAERLSQMHPSRVVLFSRAADDQTLGNRDAELYATCEADNSLSGAPCIELIRVPIDQTRYGQIDVLARPLVIPDLPTFVWWRDELDPADSTLVGLARSADLTIVDSLQFDSIQSLELFQQIADQLPAKSAIADLNWQRLQPWRELTAQFFDIRTMHWALNNIGEVEIDAGRSDDHTLPAQSLMLVGWLSYCLGWTVFEARRTRKDRWYIGFHDQGGSHVRVIVRSRPASSEWRGHLLSLSMSAHDSTYGTCSLSLSRSRGSSLIRMHARSGLHSTIHHAVYHPLLPDEALLTPVLERAVHDRMFNASLEQSVEIINLFGTPEAT
jgi:glucose-6-phosphate dehydrogenase assembly protein OpcA